MTTENKIDFTKIDWDSIDFEKLQFCFKEAVEANDALINGINKLNTKAFRLLTISVTILTALTGFLITIWDSPGKEILANTILCASVAFSYITLLFIIVIFPRSISLGRATPETLFSNNNYRQPMKKHYADGIASYHKYIGQNRKVEAFRSGFLTAGMICFFLAPLYIIVLLFCVS